LNFPGKSNGGFYSPGIEVFFSFIPNKARLKKEIDDPFKKDCIMLEIGTPIPREIHRLPALIYVP
jgi:hypothetical protein